MKKKNKKEKIMRTIKLSLFILLVSLGIAAGHAQVLAQEKSPAVADKMWGDVLPMIGTQLKQIDEEFADITVQDGFNGIYGRQQLDLKTREMCTIMILVFMGKPEELTLHLAAASKVGWKVEEIREMMILSALPAGWPSVMNGLRFLGAWAEKNKIPMPVPYSLRKDYGSTDWYKIGNELGAKTYGKKAWQDYLKTLGVLDTDLVKFAVGQMAKFNSRGRIDDRTRELCFVAGTGVTRNQKALKMHIRGALNSGATAAEIKEVLYHISAYGGMGATLQATEIFSSLVANKKEKRGK
jgi:4-carboxymuconolactone decarboxylase